MSKIKVIDLHRLSYTKSLYIQQRLFAKVLASSKETENPNYLLFVEHDPVYTVGIRNKQYIEDDSFQQKIRRLGAEFMVTNRGGLITFHGPGQLVAYPILNLKNFSVYGSIRKFVHQLESTIIDVCGQFNVKATRLDGYPGVWVDEKRKIAALGIHCSRYVTMHGVAINCDVDLDWFEHIVPCGIENKQVTSLSKERSLKITTEHVKNLFVEQFCKKLDCSTIYD